MGFIDRLTDIFDKIVEKIPGLEDKLDSLFGNSSDIDLISLGQKKGGFIGKILQYVGKKEAKDRPIQHSWYKPGTVIYDPKNNPGLFPISPFEQKLEKFANKMNIWLKGWPQKIINKFTSQRLSKNFTGKAVVNNLLKSNHTDISNQATRHLNSALENLPDQIANKIPSKALSPLITKNLSKFGSKAIPTITKKIEQWSDPLIRNIDQQIQTKILPTIDSLDQYSKLLLHSNPPDQPEPITNQDINFSEAPIAAQPISHSPPPITESDPKPNIERKTQPVTIAAYDSSPYSSTYKNLKVLMPSSEIKDSQDIAKKIYQLTNGEGIKFLFPTIPAPSFIKFFSRSRILRPVLLSTVPKIELFDKQSGCKLLELDASHYSIRDFYGHCIRSNQYQTVITFQHRIFSSPLISE